LTNLLSEMIINPNGGGNTAIDESAIVAAILLFLGSVAVFVVWLKEIAWDFIKGRFSGTVRPATLKDMLLIIVLFPVYFTGLISAVWLLFQGWDGFERTVVFSTEASFGFGFFMAAVYLVANIGGRRISKGPNHGQSYK